MCLDCIPASAARPGGRRTLNHWTQLGTHQPDASARGSAEPLADQLFSWVDVSPKLQLTWGVRYWSPQKVLGRKQLVSMITPEAQPTGDCSWNTNCGKQL